MDARRIPLPLTEVSTPEVPAPMTAPAPGVLQRRQTAPPKAVVFNLPAAAADSGMSLCFFGDPATPFADVRESRTQTAPASLSAARLRSFTGVAAPLAAPPPPGQLLRASTAPPTIVVAGSPLGPTWSPGSVYSSGAASTQRSVGGYVCPSPVGMPSPVQMDHWQAVGQRVGALFADCADMSPSPCQAAFPRRVGGPADPFCLSTMSRWQVGAPSQASSVYSASANPSPMASPLGAWTTLNPSPINSVAWHGVSQRVANVFQAYDSPFFPSSERSFASFPYAVTPVGSPAAAAA
eukprot:TRINITY_DN39803_c0_g1_i1.p1 TRINITY_DN39803_c0_g1~~TRINITY_DN39803_c0_g1_i1.p1  ORF type:complete len:315 (-),score=43.70 TRINITY_DN39803_c0_g1_i1:307-1188(-)